MHKLLSLGLLSGTLILSACATQSPEAVDAAQSALAARLNVEESAIVIVEAQETDWSDSCLGLGGPAESCLAAITPGYEVVMSHDGTEYTYRTNLDGTSVRAE